MKKFLALLLAFMTVAACIPVFASGEDEGLVNVAKNCTYTSDTPFFVEGQTSPAYHMVDGKELTDGIKGTTYGNTDWVLFHHTLPAKLPDMQVVIDLGKTYDNIVMFSVCVAAGDWGVVLPSDIKFYASEDNSAYTEIGSCIKTEGSAAMIYDYSCYAKSFVKARYIKMVLSGSGMTFVSEIEVFTGDELQDGYNDEFYINDRKELVLEGSFLKGLSEKSNISVLASQINSLEGVTVTDKNGNEKTSGYIVTGDILTKKKKKTDDLVYTFVIDGDINGDGKADAKDYQLLKRHVLKTYTASGVYMEAADVSHDGKISSMDYVLLKRYVLGTHDIYEDYGPQDGRGFVTDAWKNKVNAADGISTNTSWDMTIKRTSDKQYTFYYKAEGGDMSLTVHQTAWGTWNLGAWQLSDSAGSHRFTSESTDWEYVYRVSSSASGSVTFSGGNHANEKLRELHIYDQNGNEISLSTGKSASATLVTIVEKTNLYWDPAGDDGVYNYPDSNIYAQVTRTYTICGPQITLATDYTFTKDAYFLMSYTCMFPINKEYGLYMAAIDNEQLMTVCETLKTNPNPYGNIFYETPKASRAVIWGYGSNAAYKFDIRVLTKDSCIGSDGILRYWDMNTTENKLYFAKYPASGTKTKVAAGSEIHNEVQWNFYK